MVNGSRLLGFVVLLLVGGWLLLRMTVGAGTGAIGGTEERGGKDAAAGAAVTFPGSGAAVEAGARLERESLDGPDDFDWAAAYEAYAAWVRSTGSAKGPYRWWLETAVPLYRARWFRILEARPELQDYPLPDLEHDLPADPDWITSFNIAVSGEISALGKGMYWQERFHEGTRSEFSEEVANLRLEDPLLLTQVPPSQLASMPQYGETSRDRILEALPLLQSLRLEYLAAVAPYVTEASRLRGWRMAIQQDDPTLPEELRLPGVEEYVAVRLEELDRLMDPYRRRYLRAVGEAVGATELPPVD